MGKEGESKFNAVMEELKKINDKIDLLANRIDNLLSAKGKVKGAGKDDTVEEIKQTLKGLSLGHIVYKKHPKNGFWYFSDKTTSVFIEPPNALEGLKKVAALIDTGVYEDAQAEAFWDVFRHYEES